MFLVNSRQGHFSAAPKSSKSKSLHSRGRSLSRSYGANLPSSFTRFHSSALGYSPHLPVSVYGTDGFRLARGFSWKVLQSLRGQAARHHLRGVVAADLPTANLVARQRTFLVVLMLFGCRPSIAPHTWRRNINLLSIDYAFRPRLRNRLTLGGIAFPRKP